MQKISFVLGSDPEIFLRDIKTKELRSAIPVIPEGKREGRPLSKPGNSVLHDNVLIEVNTAPAKNKKQFVQTIGSVLQDVQKLVKKQGLELHLQASADFPMSELNSEEAKAFGCEADFGIYPEPMMNSMPAEAAEKPFRSAGGHLHIGMDEADAATAQILDDPYGKISVVKGLDIFVGIIGTFLDNDPTAKARRDLYGKAGSHRPKTYGVEYRACSPWWLASPQHTGVVYKLSEAALSLVVSKKLDEVTKQLGGEDEIRRIVDDADTEAAKKAYESCLQKLLTKEVVKEIKELENESTCGFSPGWKL